ncbi:MAG: hypothetical protein DWQ35_04320 [Planctomycetota bacterium]|nr:MAG: hypothetical protein DWQ35_04320 [Planctomycetota bacterium]REK21738.1 MAG: hypothetical protein DWQ42_18845 [Planctomycetota bacterium]REK43144.1 MAG: hypothetical protein DWQ46_12290 [Planctomycetota bacterium]
MPAIGVPSRLGRPIGRVTSSPGNLPPPLLPMLYTWFKRRRRRRLLNEAFPDEWMLYLDKAVRFYPQLTPEDQRRLRDDLRVFIAEKHWVGCNGLEVNDEMRVVIAAYACLLILRKSIDVYSRLDTILVYPDSYLALESAFPRSEPVPIGWRHGESWSHGSIVLSWNTTVDNIRDDEGENLVLHEFAHQLDMSDRFADGVPRLGSRQQYHTWKEIMAAEYEQLYDDARSGRPTLLDQYGLSDEAEFFAVATECFFLRGEEMEERHPRLYEILTEFYELDTAKMF